MNNPKQRNTQQQAPFRNQVLPSSKIKAIVPSCTVRNRTIIPLVLLIAVYPMYLILFTYNNFAKSLIYSQSTIENSVHQEIILDTNTNLHKHKTSRNRQKHKQTKKYRQSNQRINPFDSVPPESKNLSDLLMHDYDVQYDDESSCNNNNTNMIWHRYKRIQTIRRKHNDFMIPLFRSWFKNNNSNNINEIMLIDPAYHDNVGDNMITHGEIQFISNYITMEQQKMSNITINLKQCSYIQGRDYIPKCHDQFVSRNSNGYNNNNIKRIAIWHGGGNWGSLWRSVHTIRIESFQSLLTFGYDYILCMPQSLHYGSKDHNFELQDAQTIAVNIAIGLDLFNESIVSRYMRLMKEDDRQINSERSNFISSLYNDSISMLYQNSSISLLVKTRIIFVWRELYSYEKAIVLYPFVTNVILPDIAFQLGPYDGPLFYRNLLRSYSVQNNIPPRTDLLFLLRSDHESVLYQYRNKRSIQIMIDQTIDEMKSNFSLSSSTYHHEYLNNNMITFSIVDWNDRLNRFNSNDIFFTNTSIELISSGKIVITDRLHASILSYLSGLPFIYIDPISQKISKTFHVAFCNDDNVYNRNTRNLSSSEQQKTFCYDTTKEMYHSATTLLDAIRLAFDMMVQCKI